MYLDPSNFKNIGDGHTIADQINEILEPYNPMTSVPFPPRTIGPAAGNSCYKMLGTGEWQIASTCPQLIEAIPSRMHDEKKPGDVLRVPGDPLDDVADDVRYGIYTFINSAEKPRDLQVLELVQPLAAQHDLTSAQGRHCGGRRTARVLPGSGWACSHSRASPVAGELQAA